MPSSPCPIQLIVGLSNPGQEYARSRHNAGAWLVEALANTTSSHFQKKPTLHGRVAKLVFGALHCWLLLPSTYMNHSGQAVGALARFYQLSPEAILIVHDDLDLLPGTIRFKQGGGDGGHNGLKDVVRHLGSPAFWRLRIGIGHPGHRDEVHDYVLSSPSGIDLQKIDVAIAHTLGPLLRFVQGEQQQSIQTVHQLNATITKE